jgi:gas vesicle protein
MAEEPHRLRQDIEQTRGTLTRDVDLLAEKTSPRKAAQRRWSAVKERVMGTSQQARHSVGDSAHTVADKASQLGDKASQLGDRAGSAAQDLGESVRTAPRAVAQQTQGNPLAAGIIAFGVGMLAGTLLPVTDAERRAGQQVKENAGDLGDRAKQAVGELKDDLAGSAQQAAAQVRDVAQDAARTTGQQARSSAQDATEASYPAS